MSQGKYSLWFDDNQIPALVRHRLARFDQFETLMKWGYRPDDANEYLDLGLMDHPTNAGVLPFSVQSVEDVGREPIEEESPVEPRRKPSPEMRALHQLEAALARASKKYENIRSAVNKLRKKMIKQAAGKYSRYYMEQRKRVLARISQLPDRSAASAGARQEGEIERLVEILLPGEAENQSLTTLISPMLAEHIRESWKQVNDELSIPQTDNPFQIDDPRVRDAVEKRKIQGTKINDTTADDLRDILRKSFDEGWTQTQLSDAIGSYYKEHVGESKARPQTAAATQTAGTVNDGRLAAAKSAGNLRKWWLHGGSAEPREAHVAAQTKYQAEPISLEEKFIVNGHSADAPGDAELPVEEVAHCTCIVVFAAA